MERRMNPRFRLAIPEIASFFRSDSRMAYDRKDLEIILDSQRKNWMMRSDFSVSAFIDDLVVSRIIKKRVFTFLQHTYLVYTKYGKVDVYELVAKASEKGYYSHLSAVYFHGLTDQVPKDIYLSIAQPRMRFVERSKLSQSTIDDSFTKDTRLTNAFAKVMLNKVQWTIYQLFGTVYHHEKDLNSLETFLYKDGIKLTRTSPERTLIDIAIRPEYSGGIEIVREAYTNAQSMVSVNKLGAILKGMNTIYPYHQAIGFLMDISGNYTDAQLGVLRRIPQEYDFYLLHGYNKEGFKYDKTWRIYYPSYLEF